MYTCVSPENDKIFERLLSKTDRNRSHSIGLRSVSFKSKVCFIYNSLKDNVNYEKKFRSNRTVAKRYAKPRIWNHNLNK